MHIAIVGTGAIGSTFAYKLAKAGHTVTVIARGARLDQLQRDRAIVLASGERATVEVHAALDTTIAYDLVLVTVLAPQVGTVLPTLRASAARAVMFMFNTFEPLDPLRDAVGAERFVFGFPGGVFTLLRDGKIAPQIRAGTTVGDASWAKTFTDAGIPTVVDEDMHAWLRSHAALVIPLMAIGTVVAERRAGISWREASTYAEAMEIAFRIVRELGHTIAPSALRTLSRLPRSIIQAVLWAMSRTRMLRELGELGTAEPRMLIDMMTAAAPGKTAALLAIRP
ncbi:2-dehydropantoate 2-reductase [Minicystis rosea]|nr:2-dehydropantoate 2-reductase [Minicystis rosea]